MHRSVDDLGKYAGKPPVYMWTSGAVDMWITVAAQSPCQVPGLSPTPPGDHPAAGMRRSRRPRAAADGQDRTGRRQMRPIRAVRMSRGPGPQRGRGTANCRTRSPGSRTALRPSGPLSSGWAAAQPERDNALSGADRRAGDARSRARNAAQEAARARKAAGFRPRGIGLGPPRPRTAGPGP